MIELSIPYINELASQMMFTSTFLGGFSATLLGTLLVAEYNNRISKVLIASSALAAISFIICILFMNKLVMLTTPGYPLEINNQIMEVPRIIGFVFFMIGILALMFLIALSGWLKSKQLGWMTTIFGIIGFVFMFIAMT